MPTTELEALEAYILYEGNRWVPLFCMTDPTLTRKAFIPEHANTGLWYDKFPNLWGKNWRKEGMQHTCTIEWQPDPTKRSKNAKHTLGKLTWIESVAESWYRPKTPPCGSPELIAEMCMRQSLLTKSMNGKCIALTNDSRFVSGLGREHPVENGFAWHQTLGTPYLPGSSIKGMLRAWAKSEEKSKEADRLLGSERDGAGRVVLLDMLPSAPIKLVADVMTPHYGPYYQEKQTPGDWYSPIPIPFLACEASQRWQTAFLPGSRCESDQEFNGDSEIILQWLTDALAWQGAGAKTAVGYGRFSVADQP